MTDHKLLELLLQKVTTMESAIQSVQLNQQSIQSEQQRHSDLLHQLIQIVGATNARVDTMQSDLTSMKSDLTSLQSDLQNMQSDLQSTKSNMATKADIAEVTLSLKQLIENQKSIHEVLGEHEVAIRTLRRKPV